LTWNIDYDRPIWIQLVEQLQAALISGELKPGDAVPSVRDLAADAQVNINTMQRALAELENRGLVVPKDNRWRASGRAVTEDRSLIDEIRRDYAGSILEDFTQKMRSLGLDDDEIVSKVSEYLSKTCRKGD
jgi:GntR family transcriptional regulator